MMESILFELFIRYGLAAWFFKAPEGLHIRNRYGLNRVEQAQCRTKRE